MKKLFISAALLALLAAPALAQREGGPQRGPGTEQRDRGPESGGMRGPRQPDRQQMAPQAQPQPGAMSMQRGDRDNDRDRNNWNDNRRGDNNRFDNDRRDNRGWDRDRGGRDGWNDRRGGNGPRADFRRYQRNFAAPQRFRAPAYRRPPGWYAHRWTFGEVLPAAFFGRSYWIDNFYNFGLMSPPLGTVWVRYGADALLIDRYNGEVVQVVYRVFY